MTAPTNNIFTPFLAQAPLIYGNQQYETRVTNNASGSPLYLGLNITPNAATSSNTWYVLKFLYDGNGYLDRQQLPDNGAGFYYIWDDVTTYFS